MIFTVLIHHRQAFNAASRRPAFGNINHTSVEITFFTGQTLINRISHNVSDSAPVIFFSGERFTQKLLGRNHIPKAEINLNIAVFLFDDLALNQSLRFNGLPIHKFRLFVYGSKFLNIAAFGNNFEKSASIKVSQNNFTNLIAIIITDKLSKNIRITAKHFRHGKRHRVAGCSSHINFQFGVRRKSKQHQQCCQNILNFHQIYLINFCSF